MDRYKERHEETTEGREQLWIASDLWSLRPLPLKLSICDSLCKSHLDGLLLSWKKII